MKTTRRQFSLSVAGFVLAACSSEDAPPAAPPGDDGNTLPGSEPTSPWLPDGTEDAAAFPTGVQIGDATSSAAIVSLRTQETVSLHVALGGADGWEPAGVLQDLAPDDGVVQVELTDLDPDQGYSVVFFAADGTRRSAVARFRSALADGTNRILRFGATSCLGGNEPWATLTVASQQRYDFFLLLGDTIYADRAPDAFDYEKKFETALAVQGLRDLSTSTSYVATWDDHEVDNNWSWDNTSEETVDAAVLAFRRAVPQRVGSGDLGLWRKLSWGDAAELFVLDSRGERRDGNYMSVEQMTWLKESLSASTARFKLIVNSVPIIDFAGTPIGDLGAEDRWQGFPAQRSEIMSHIDDNGIAGVLWLSGDFHIGGIATASPDGEPGAGMYDVLCGPGGSNINPGSLLIDESDRLPVIVKKHNYTDFEIDPDSGSVKITYFDDAGEVLDSYELSL